MGFYFAIIVYFNGNTYSICHRDSVEKYEDKNVSHLLATYTIYKDYLDDENIMDFLIKYNPQGDNCFNDWEEGDCRGQCCDGWITVDLDSGIKISDNYIYKINDGGYNSKKEKTIVDRTELLSQPKYKDDFINYIKRKFLVSYIFGSRFEKLFIEYFICNYM